MPHSDSCTATKKPRIQCCQITLASTLFDFLCSSYFNVAGKSSNLILFYFKFPWMPLTYNFCFSVSLSQLHEGLQGSASGFFVNEQQGNSMRLYPHRSCQSHQRIPVMFSIIQWYVFIVASLQYLQRHWQPAHLNSSTIPSCCLNILSASLIFIRPQWRIVDSVLLE